MTQSSIIMPGAEPFFYRGGGTGVLCIHGFTANPSEMRWLGQHLAAQGHAVCGVRLAGHGSSPYDMARMRWRDWLASALDGVALLRAVCPRVIVVGHSMGGLLGLLLAAQGQIDALSVLASPVLLSSRLQGSRWWRYVRPFTEQPDKSGLEDIIRAEQRRRGEPVVGRIRYNLWSTSAVYELVEVSRHAEAALPRVAVPLQLIYSRGDRTVPVADGEHILRRVASPTPDFRVLETSGHILPQDVQRETVFQGVSEFVGRNGVQNAQGDYRPASADLAAHA